MVKSSCNGLNSIVCQANLSFRMLGHTTVLMIRDVITNRSAWKILVFMLETQREVPYQ